MKNKLMIILAAGILSTMGAMSAFASSRVDSWDVVMADENMAWVGQGAYADAFGPTGFFNACVSGTELHSIAPVSYCASGHDVAFGDGMGSTRFVCDQMAQKAVSMAISHNEQVCTKYEGSGDTYSVCAAYATETVTIPTTQSFSVYLRASDKHSQYYGNAMFAFTKDFTIPSCK